MPVPLAISSEILSLAIHILLLCQTHISTHAVLAQARWIPASVRSPENSATQSVVPLHPLWDCIWPLMLIFVPSQCLSCLLSILRQSVRGGCCEHCRPRPKSSQSSGRPKTLRFQCEESLGDMLAGSDKEIFVNVRPGQMEIFSRESQQLTIITDTGWQIWASLRDANLPYLPIDASDCPSQRNNLALNVQRISTEFE